jgi:hypothetical protein
MRRSAEVLPGRMRQEPWTAPSWPLRPSWGVAQVDESDAEFFLGPSSAVTAFAYPPYGSGSDAADPAALGVLGLGRRSAAPAAEMEDAGGAQGRPGDVAALRSDAAVTPVAALALLTQGGTARLAFPAPGRVGSYAVRVFAVTRDGRFGQAEGELAVRQPLLSLQPDLPRLVRVGDEFLAGATLSLTGAPAAAPVLGRVQLQVDCALLLPAASSSLSVWAPADGTPVEALFPLRAAGYGPAAYRLAVYSADGQLQDAIEGELPVLGQQEGVYAATSMAIQAGAAAQPWAEGLALPGAVPYSGDLLLTAGLGHLPAVASDASSLFPSPPGMSGLSWASQLAPWPAVAVYGPTGSWALGRQAQAAYGEALRQLGRFTDATYGLQWSAPSASHGPAAYVPWLDGFALHLSNRGVAELGSPAKVSPEVMAKTWQKALEQGLYQTEAAQKKGFGDWDLLALTYMALGVQWTPAKAKDVLSLANLQAHADSCSNQGKAMLALAHLYADPASAALPEVAALLDFFESFLRIQGRTAYLAKAPGSRSADVTGSCLALEALARARRSSPAVEKLANFVAQMPEDGAPPGQAASWWWSREQLAYATLALAAYDQTRGSARPHASFSVRSGDGTQLLAAEFDSPSSPPVSISVPFEAIDDSTLEFWAKGSGEVSVVAALRWVPAELPAEGVYRGMRVEKLVRPYNLTAAHSFPGDLRALRRGQQVEVTLQVTLADGLANVWLLDPQAGGLEALDASVFSSSSAASDDDVGSRAVEDDDGEFAAQDWSAAPFAERAALEGRSGQWWAGWGSGFFGRASVRSDGVGWFAPWLPAGTHSVSYSALANTRGEFVLPPAKAWAELQPELMGLSPAGSVVVEPEAVAAAFPGPDATEEGEGGRCLPHEARPAVFVDPFPPGESRSGAGHDGSGGGGLGVLGLLGVAAVALLAVVVVAALLALALVVWRRWAKRAETQGYSPSPLQEDEAEDQLFDL